VRKLGEKLFEKIEAPNNSYVISQKKSPCFFFLSLILKNWEGARKKKMIRLNREEIQYRSNFFLSKRNRFLKCV